jgi:hypothetical protein
MSPQIGGGIDRGFDGGISGSGGFMGTPVGPPTVTAVVPDNGSSGGGTLIVISGTNFQGTTAVTFGMTPATSFTVINSTTINATSPAGPGETTVDITITTPAGTSATNVADLFTWTSIVACGGALDLSTGCGTPQIGIR